MNLKNLKMRMTLSVNLIKKYKKMKLIYKKILFRLKSKITKKMKKLNK